MADYAVMPVADYQDACNAVREKTGGKDVIKSGDIGGQIRSIDTQENLDEELATQDSLIAQITAALEGKTVPSGGGAKIAYGLLVPYGANINAPGYLFIFEDGMTWSDLIGSQYNVQFRHPFPTVDSVNKAFSIYEQYVYAADQGTDYHITIDNTSAGRVNPTDSIISGAKYYIYWND